MTNFETFKAGQSSMGTTTNPSSEEGSSHGIVANLADLTKLGATAMLGNTEEFTDEASNYFGHTLTSDETCLYLREMYRYKKSVSLSEGLRCTSTLQACLPCLTQNQETRKVRLVPVSVSSTASTA